MTETEPTPQAILPIYVLVDESYSMHLASESLAHGSGSLLESLRARPMAAAGIRLSLIGFSDTATVYLALADVREITSLPALHPRGGTSYGAAFRELAMRLAIDLDDLRLQGHRIRRPVVFFLTDGMPTDSRWREDLFVLVRDFQPSIVAFGIGDADEKVLLEIATNPRFAFASSPKRSLDRALSAFLDSLTTSIVASSSTFERFSGELVVDVPEGFESLGSIVSTDAADT